MYGMISCSGVPRMTAKSNGRYWRGPRHLFGEHGKAACRRLPCDMLLNQISRLLVTGLRVVGLNVICPCRSLEFSLSFPLRSPTSEESVKARLARDQR